MSECPRCHQPVDARAIVCPSCRTALKAYGHPGMPLYRAIGQEPLCLTCTYHKDDTCTFPKRPDALDCTLYNDCREPILASSLSRYERGFLIKTWLKRNLTWLVLLGLLFMSLLIALFR